MDKPPIIALPARVVRTRAEVVEVIQAQMDHGDFLLAPVPLNAPNAIKHKSHYGYMELRYLRGYIYGGPPATEEEELNDLDKVGN